MMVIISGHMHIRDSNYITKSIITLLQGLLLEKSHRTSEQLCEQFNSFHFILLVVTKTIRL